MGSLVVRFVVGGLIVAAFAVLGHILRPKSFAGIFGAAPSVALATLTLTYVQDGARYATIEARSMAIGAVALGCYGLVVTWMLLRRDWNATLAAGSSWLVWLVVAFGLWAALLR